MKKRLNQQFDILPFPYRFVDKLVRKIISEAFDEINILEKDHVESLLHHQKRNESIVKLPPTVEFEEYNFSEESSLYFPGNNKIIVFEPNDLMLYVYSSFYEMGKISLSQFKCSHGQDVLNKQPIVQFSNSLTNDDLFTFGLEPFYMVFGYVCSCRNHFHLLLLQEVEKRPVMTELMSFSLIQEISGSPLSTTTVRKDDKKTRKKSKRRESKIPSRKKKVEEEEGETKIDPVHCKNFWISGDGRNAVFLISDSVLLFDFFPPSSLPNQQKRQGFVPSQCFAQPKPKSILKKVAEIKETESGRKSQPKKRISDSSKSQVIKFTPKLEFVIPLEKNPQFSDSPNQSIKSDNTVIDAKFVYNSLFLDDIRDLNTNFILYQFEKVKKKNFLHQILIYQPRTSNYLDIVTPIEWTSQKVFFPSEISLVHSNSVKHKSSMIVGIGLVSGTFIGLNSMSGGMESYISTLRNPICCCSFYMRKYITVGHDNGFVEIFSCGSGTSPLQIIKCYPSVSKLVSMSRIPFFLVFSDSHIDILDLKSGTGLGTCEFGKGTSFSSIVVVKKPSGSLLVYDMFDRNNRTGIYAIYPNMIRYFTRKKVSEVYDFLSGTEHSKRNDTKTIENFNNKYSSVVSSSIIHKEFSEIKKKSLSDQKNLISQIALPRKNDAISQFIHIGSVRKTDTGKQKSPLNSPLSNEKSGGVRFSEKMVTPRFLTYKDLTRMKRDADKLVYNFQSVRINRAKKRIENEKIGRNQRLKSYLQ